MYILGVVMVVGWPWGLFLVSLLDEVYEVFYGIFMVGVHDIFDHGFEVFYFCL